MNTRHVALSMVTMLLSGCSIEHARTGPTRTEPFAVERDKSEFLRVNLNMKAGELRLSGGASKFLDGSATYNVEGAKPVVKYTSTAGRGDLRIEQPGSGAMVGDVKYQWNVRLPDDIPVDLSVDFGAGEGHMNIGNMSLRSVEVHIGAGTLDLDLRGNPKRDYDVKVRGGVGEAVIHVPKDVGVYATAGGGLGSIDTRGLRQEGDHYVNDAYDHARRTIRLDVRGGVGEIRIISE
jgi:hypothetical protein